MRSTRVFLLVAFIAITATGCGNGQGETPDVDQLLQRLPSQGSFGKDLMAIDFVAAREQLGLPADADPFEIKGVLTADGRIESSDREFREFRLNNLTIQILPFRVGAALGALDGGEVTAAAATRVGTREEVMILATRQSFDELAAALKERGFEEDGDLLLDANPRTSPSFSAVADARDGTIVLAGSADAAEEVLTDGERSEAATLLGSVSGVARRASMRIRSDCLLGIAAGQELEPPEGQIAVGVRGEPNADSLAIPFRADSPPAAKNPLTQVLSRLRYDEPVSTDDGVMVDVRYRPKGEASLGASSVTPVAIPLLDGASAIYRCR